MSWGGTGCRPAGRGRGPRGGGTLTQNLGRNGGGPVGVSRGCAAPVCNFARKNFVTFDDVCTRPVGVNDTIEKKLSTDVSGDVVRTARASLPRASFIGAPRSLTSRYCAAVVPGVCPAPDCLLIMRQCTFTTSRSLTVCSRVHQRIITSRRRRAGRSRGEPSLELDYNAAAEVGLSNFHFITTYEMVDPRALCYSYLVSYLRNGGFDRYL